MKEESESEEEQKGVVGMLLNADIGHDLLLQRSSLSSWDLLLKTHTELILSTSYHGVGFRVP